MPESSGVGGGGFPGERADPGSWAPFSTWLKDYFMENIPKDCFRKNIIIIQRMIRDRSETDRENPDG